MLRWRVRREFNWAVRRLPNCSFRPTSIEFQSADLLAWGDASGNVSTNGEWNYVMCHNLRLGVRRDSAIMSGLLLPGHFPNHRFVNHRAEALRSGFSLIELLVVIAVSGILIAIALPMITSMRESARSVECKNRLKQLGLALQNHQGQFSVLPQDGYRGHGFSAFLLPQLEQSALFQKLNPLSQQQVNPSLAAVGVEDAVLPVFRCPSSSLSDRLAQSQFGRSNYLGTDYLFKTAMSLADVHDGESNTLAVGETITDQAWALPGTGTTDWPPNAGGRFGGMHPGGTYFVLCDGAVRFISNQIDAGTFKSLGTPSGNEVIGEF